MKNCSTSLICLNQININNEFLEIFNAGRNNNKCNFNWAHADFMDGHFVPRLGIAPELIKHLREEYGNSIIIDSHMMVSDPFTYADVVCPYSDYYMFHAESVTDPMRTIQKVRKNWPNVKIGLYFNLSTDIIFQYKNILPYIDCIGLMGISPGVLGTNSYFDVVKNKLIEYKYYSKKLINLPNEIFIDGSVNFETIPEYFNLGATTLVCGSSSIMKDLKNTTIEKNIDKIVNCINN
jgi:ribulose-phosphate 3-epimerase